MMLKNVQIDRDGKIIAGEPVEEHLTPGTVSGPQEMSTPEEVEGRIQQIVMQRDGAMMQAIMLGGQVARLQKQLADTAPLVGEIVKLKARVIELELLLAAKNGATPPTPPSTGAGGVVEELKRDPKFKETTRQ